MTDHAAWRDELEAFSRDKRPAARIGAAVGLADLRSAQAIELLHGLAADPDHAVRATALQEVANLRRKDGIGLLIDRLEVETGVMHQRVVNLLRLVTGEDFGTGGRWRRWWDDVEDSFEVPDYEAALAAERSRAAARDEGGTQASFYGLRIVSDRVTFILDTSGSMSAKAKAPGGRTTTGGADSTRIEIAKDQLSRAVSRLPDGDLFNMIFFSGGVRPWNDAVTKMTKSSRAEALAFVARQKAAGATAVYDALERAFEDERVDTIFLLTDGSPSAGKIQDEGRIAQAIARLNSVRMVQINCISVGRRSALLRRLAEDSGGTYREVL